MTTIQEYPAFSALALEQRPVLHPFFQRLAEGISELTFAGIYLFRTAHRYQVSRLGEDLFVFSGADGRPFVLLPFGLPERAVLDRLFEQFGQMKAVSAPQAEQLSRMGYATWEDRDSFDYLYRRDSLAALSGRRLHRKKNLVNVFLRDNVCVARPLLEEYTGDALQILEQWRQQQGSLAVTSAEGARCGGLGQKATDTGDNVAAPGVQSSSAGIDPASPGDYAAAREALENMEYLQLCGGIFYVDDEPVAYTLGEELAQGRMFVVHFEKAILKKEYRGIYQYVNQAFAALLPDKYELINREQDLGDPGLRQAKESYRPAGFVPKYRVAANAEREEQVEAPRDGPDHVIAGP
jgi:hypothetical protein